MSVLAAAIFLLTRAPTTPTTPADLVLVSARIWTGDPARPEAAALAVRGGRIVAIGTNSEIGPMRGAKTVVVEGKGRRVVPGFIDCHTHMSMGGFNLLGVDLRHTKDPADFTRQLAEFAKTRPPGLWMTDGAWDHQVWANPILPTRAMLDPATGDRPACLSRTDGHMMVCNSLALKLAKITRDTPDPPGGVIVRVVGKRVWQDMKDKGRVAPTGSSRWRSTCGAGRSRSRHRATSTCTPARATTTAVRSAAPGVRPASSSSETSRQYWATSLARAGSTG